MKKTLLIIGAVILVIIITLAAIPFLFKDKIKQGVDAAIADYVQADISYHDFDLSLLRSFPNLQLSAKRIGVVGQDLFLGDTLIYTNEASVNVDLKSVFFGDQVVIRQVKLVDPKILIKILDDGTTNYDITKTADSTDTGESGYDIKVTRWTVENGALKYDDNETKFYLELDELTHEGSGDFTEQLFDLKTQTEGHLVTANYEGVSYLENKQIVGDVTLELNLPQSLYTFKENRVSINEFAFGFQGWVALPENSDDINMDLTFEAQQNDFQSLLSLVPGMYSDQFKELKTSGQVAMGGLVKGTYNEQIWPAFELKLKVTEGMFQYPDLPRAVENINVDLSLINEDGNIDHTLVDIKEMHLDFGDNPVDGRIRLDGLEKSLVDADVKAKINLSDLSQMLPMKGTILKGNYDLALKAQGTYDSATQQFPRIDAQMRLKDGYIKSNQFPEALEQFNMTSRVQNSNGKMAETLIEVPDFSFLMDGQPLSGRLTLKNLEDYQWDLLVNGSLDLEKLTRIFPLEGKTLKGNIKGNLATKGRMSDLEAEKYQLLPTSGNLAISDFTYQDKDLAYPFNIKTGQASFDPQKITLTDIQAHTGSSDLKLQGNLSNYINYVFKDDEVIRGNLELHSQNLNLNEWMTETADTSSAALEVLEIPKNVDFYVKSTIGTVHYDNMTLTNVDGAVKISEGIAKMEQVVFGSLGGQFAINGNYDSRDLKHPKFDFNMSIVDVRVKQAFNTFNTVRVLAPVAKLFDGDFTSDFKLSGELGQNMMPLLNTLSGGGLVKILEGVLAGADSKLVQGLSNLTRFSEKPSSFSLRDVIMNIQIKEGKLNVKPFDVAFGQYATKVSGSTGIDGSMEFLLNMEVPAGVVGTSVNQAIAKLTGNQEASGDMVKLNIKLGGTFSDPTFSLGGREGGATTASMAQDAVNEKLDEAKDSVRTIADQKTQEIKQKGKAQLDSLLKEQIKDSTSNQVIRDVKDNILKEKQVDNVLDILKKKKKPAVDSTQNHPQ